MLNLIECIPNFSVSEESDPKAFQRLVEIAKNSAGCTLLDVQTDGDHNRSVFTYVGSPEAVEDLTMSLCVEAVKSIDMTRHHGQHPRMGAVDVIPFVPLTGISLDDCVALSKKFAKRLWEELEVPSFLYEASATTANRKNLAACRKGQFEGMPEKLLQEEWAPDFGERHIHPTAGVTAIGARKSLIAFNVNLGTNDLSIAKSIAKAIRGSSGGFSCCKAIGIALEDRGIVQVSMNMVDYETTPLYYAYEMIRTLASRYGVRIIESEVVGLTPAKALLDCASFYLKLNAFDTHKQVMEYSLLANN